MTEETEKGAPQEFKVMRNNAAESESAEEIKGSSGTMADFLARRETERTPEEQAEVEQLRKRAGDVFVHLTGTELPEDRNVVSMQELSQFKKQWRDATAKGPIRLEVISSIIPKSSFLSTREGGMVGVDPTAKDGEIGHELFHAYLQKDFLRRPGTSQALDRIAENLERQFAYQRYLKDQNFVTGKETDRLRYETDTGEISARILDDCLDIEQEQREKLSRPAFKRDTRRYARGGHENDVAQVLAEYEDYIRQKTGKPIMSWRARLAL